MRLLYAEDEKDLNKIVTATLTDAGYSVDSCFDGEEAMDYIDSADYDAILLDIMMPKADGYEVLKHLRGAGIETPVIFLTAKDAVGDIVKGLDDGADDFLVKPFSLEELLARVRALLRKRYGGGDSSLKVGDLIMDTAAHIVKRGKKTIELSAKEYALLEYLMINAGKVLSRENIEDHIWNFDYEGGTNVVDVYISYLRRKIDDGFDNKLIHTVRGAGYVIRESDK